MSSLRSGSSTWGDRHRRVSASLPVGAMIRKQVKKYKTGKLGTWRGINPVARETRVSPRERRE